MSEIIFRGGVAISGDVKALFLEKIGTEVIFFYFLKVIEILSPTELFLEASCSN